MSLKNCKNCGVDFEIFEADLELYGKLARIFDGNKFEIPMPTFCPDCRQRRRMSFRNERNFYHRKCDLTGANIISTYAPDFKGKVYSQDAFWGDSWDSKKHGRDFDFNRSFFEQYLELSLDCPRICMVNMSSENSLYTNHSAYNKNCYMCVNVGWCEDVLYSSNYCLYNKNCVDCLMIRECELCYFCVNTQSSFRSFYLYECVGCNDSQFLYNCHGCNECFCCWNLRHKSFCIFNEQYSEAEYREKVAELIPKTWKEYMNIFEKFWEMVSKKAVHKNLVMEKCQSCTGDHILTSKNVRDSYYVFGSEDCAYMYDAGEIKNCIDVVEPFHGELEYETHACNMGYGLMACSKCYEDNNLLYSQYCWNSSNLFGCFGMKREKYCILNKQYSEEKYEKMVAKIVSHMWVTGEWGEFFPLESSAFAYNETVANDYYPMTKEEVLAKGWRWRDEEDREYSGNSYKVPADIVDVNDDICDGVLVCEKTGRPYKIVAAELTFYRKTNLPIPEFCPDERHKMRMALRNPRHLWERDCMKCGKTIHSSYAPNRPDIVYCEECYLKEVY